MKVKSSIRYWTTCAVRCVSGGLTRPILKKFIRRLSRGASPGRSRKKRRISPVGPSIDRAFFFLWKRKSSAPCATVRPFPSYSLRLSGRFPGQDAPGAINQNDVYQAVLERLARLARDPDMVGSLDKSRMIWLLPMTIPEDVQVARQRIIGELHRHVYNVKGIPLKVRLAAAVKDFSHEELPPLRTFSEKGGRIAARDGDSTAQSSKI